MSRKSAAQILVSTSKVSIFQAYKSDFIGFYNSLCEHIEEWRTKINIYDRKPGTRMEKTIRLFKKLRTLPPCSVVTISYLDIYAESEHHTEPLLGLLNDFALERSLCIIVLSRAMALEEYYDEEPETPLDPKKVLIKWPVNKYVA
jgi:hypothetical protein